MKELIIEFGNDTLGETRMYQRNFKGYEQAIKDLKLYKAQQKAEIDYIKAKITAECKEHQETMRLADKTIRLLDKTLDLMSECFYNNFIKVLEPYCGNCTSAEAIKKSFKKQAEEMMKSE